MHRSGHEKSGLGLALLLCVGSLHGQNLVANGDFAEGSQQPAGWTLVDGKGEWTGLGPVTARSVAVEGTGQDQSYWRAEPRSLRGGEMYGFRFRGRRVREAAGGTGIAGISRANRDFPLTSEWQAHRFVFVVPEDGGADFVRIGQWCVNGRLEFDDVELLPVRASHLVLGGLPGPALRLGEAESVQGRTYRFQPQYGWAGASYHRPLWRNRAGFNSDRWVFVQDAEVVYRFELAGRRQTAAKVQVAIHHYRAGILRVEASRDGTNWLAAAQLDGTNRSVKADLPTSLFPAEGVFVRMSTPGAGTELQVNTLVYEAAIDQPIEGSREGATRFLEVETPETDIAVEDFTLDPSPNVRGMAASIAVANRSGVDQRLTAHLWVPPGRQLRNVDLAEAELKPGQVHTFKLEAEFGTAGDHPVALRVCDGRGRVLFAGRSQVRVSWLHDPRMGYAILPGAENPRVWWCEGGWKVGRSTPPPPPGRDGGYKAVTLSVAQGEFEPVQIVVAPGTADRLVEARVEPWAGGPRGSAAIETRLNEVAYVCVTTPTDGIGERGWHPDPLPPLVLPRPLKPAENFTLWLTVRVPDGTPGGEYTSTLRLKTDVERIAVPLAVRVYDFALPVRSHLRSALGLGTGEINRYHRLTERAHQETVFNRYLENFAEHRISPYSFFDYAPIEVNIAGDGSDRKVHVDFTQFDAAATLWLDPGRFNNFQLPIRGMGGGTFHERYLGEFGGFKEGTLEHARLFRDYLGQVERHLRQRGWLDRAFVYWFDEPDPKDYEFVVAGMQRLKDAAPGLKRMLTEQPEPALMGHVDVWCGLTPEWTPERVQARRRAGEEVWWYICCAPKAPYVTEFIDHPGTELRLWPWQSWQYGVTGILIWATIYWNSPVAYPPPDLQDPWQDPMSWVSGYGTPPGSRLPWGNGDGRFLYPPRPDPNAPAGPNLDGPINSIRWENLRDGMEDYEYFWLLERQIEARAAAEGESPLVREARSLLRVPPEVSQDLTHFTQDPRPLLEHRDRLARMIERLIPELARRN